MGNDKAYLDFKLATNKFRQWGFYCFLTEVITFVLSFLVNLYNKLWDDAREHGSELKLTSTGLCVMAGTLVLVFFGVFQIGVVLKLASEYKIKMYTIN